MKKILLSLFTASLFAVIAQADSVDFLHIILKKAVSGSSSVLMEKNKPADYYGPSKAFDGEYATAWCEGKKDEGIGEFVWFETSPVQTDGVVVLNGFGKSRYLYFQNNRVKDYRLTVYPVKGKEKVITGRFRKNLCGRHLAGGKLGIGEFCEEMKYEADKDNRPFDLKKCIAAKKDECIIDEYDGGGQRIMLKKPVKIRKVKLEILSVYKGKKFNDTCIAEIRLLKDANRPY